MVHAWGSEDEVSDLFFSMVEATAWYGLQQSKVIPPSLYREFLGLFIQSPVRAEVWRFW